ncbi:MAG: hypothetical protein ACREQZ_15530 [Woeseiaceae bacterium]
MRILVLGAGLALLGVAQAGHEFPFYPSFYPQEITVEALDAHAAAQRLAQGTLHAYAGALDAAKTGSVASLGGYVVATFERDGCAAARGMQDALGKGAVWHPYPVTPFHADYLHHADRAEAARAGAVAEQGGARAHIEIVDVAVLMAKASVRYSGWSGPPWIRQGWFHAYLLLAPGVADAGIENAARRLMRGDHRSLEERIDLERSLVAMLQARCERVVLGYTVRREHYGVEYSAGVENVGYDALEGLASAIFPRTVKLRDFPWNGWLNVAAPAPPASPWNPLVGGFADAFGRLVWSALADPAFLPSPHSGGWIENRVSARIEKNRRPFAVPEDAQFTAGRGQKAALRIVYRVRNSSFHDGTTMSIADLAYAYAFAANLGIVPDRLKGVRLLRVETETLAFGEDKLSYQVPVIEVYLDGGTGGDAATVAPPWTTMPWHLLALFEEGARRGHFMLADFDPVRDAALVRRLAETARELEERAYVPPALASYVSAQQARTRYRRLRAFHAAHGHWLVTNGPYLLSRWDGTKAVLGAFRDPTYPKGLGSFNAYAVPLKAHVTRIERRGHGAQVRIETERLEREGRELRIVRGSPQAKQAPVCRYLLVRPDGTVGAAGAVRSAAGGICRIELKGLGRLVVAAVLEDAAANAPIRIVPWAD